MSHIMLDPWVPHCLPIEIIVINNHCLIMINNDVLLTFSLNILDTVYFYFLT